MVLLAVLIGACLPVLVQLALTLAATRRLLERLGPKLDGTLAELHETSRRLNRATTGIDESAQHARAILDAAGDLGQTLQQLNRLLRPALVVGGVLAPAVIVAIKALIARYGGNPEGEGNDDAHEPDHAESNDTSQPHMPEAKMRSGQGGGS